MRPYADELLERMRESLTAVIAPSITEAWPRYVATAMALLLEHLELRWRHELAFLAEDTLDMRELFDGMRVAFTSDDLVSTGAIADIVADIEDVLAEPAKAAAAVELRALSEENEAHRAVLERALIRLDDLTDPADSELRDLRDSVRSLLRRQLDRDVKLARPTFMQFGPT